MRLSKAVLLASLITVCAPVALAHGGRGGGRGERASGVESFEQRGEGKRGGGGAERGLSKATDPAEIVARFTEFTTNAVDRTNLQFNNTADVTVNSIEALDARNAPETRITRAGDRGKLRIDALGLRHDGQIERVQLRVVERLTELGADASFADQVNAAAASAMSAVDGTAATAKGAIDAAVAAANAG
ncbi:MAG: hypothetical protein SFZ24_00240 [Planctomycetota bacterium]|nr:hypothetical protein [Planctomycetota bacterium]